MSKLPWLRLYSDAVDNEKLRLLAFEDRWHFVAVLCLKQQGILTSKPELLERKIAIKLGLRLPELDEVKRRLMDVELIDVNWMPIGWDSKQFNSDSSADRTRKYRENKNKKVSDKKETSQERHGDPVDTDTDTDTDIHIKKKTPKFKKPTLEEANNYITEKGYSFSGEDFICGNEAKGWVVGKSNAPMKCWKSAMYIWQKVRSNDNGTRSSQAAPRQPDNSATRHHDRLKRAYAEAIAEEMDSETVQQVPSDLQPQMVVSN